jgi:CheY-like chemotaxis protein
MSKTILIVESDAALSSSLRSELESRGFTVEETSDGKGSVELIRRQRPDLVVMAVDLSAGQNGYILCGKLKKDDELKTVPVVIMGNPDGFAQHSKLKTRADDYLAKPVDADGLVTTVGNLIGLPELPAAAAPADEGLTGADLMDGEAEEISVDAELDSLDDAFADLSSAPQAVSAGSALDGDEGYATSALDESPDSALDMAVVDEPVEVPEEASVTGEEEFASLNVEEDDGSDSALSALGEPGPSGAPASALDGAGGASSLDLDGEDPLASFAPAPELPTPPPAPAPRAAPPPPPARAAAPSAPAPAAPIASARPAVPAAPARALGTSLPSAADASELRALRAQVAELQASLEDVRAQLSERDGRVHELEGELERKSSELDAARTTGGKSEKEFFALREAGNRKDKEILRLKGELHEKEQELVALREREMALEQQANDGGAEVAKRDAQLKTLATRAEQLTADRRRLEQQLAQAREEARGAQARAGAVEAEVGPLHEQLRAAQEEAEALRAHAEQAAGASEELERARAELEAMRAEVEAARHQVGELQTASRRADERVEKLYARIKADEKLRERTRKALSIAQQLLDENAAALADSDEAAA